GGLLRVDKIQGRCGPRGEKRQAGQARLRLWSTISAGNDLRDAMLYDPDRHEPLSPSDRDNWDEGRARACIAAIVRDTQAQFIGQHGWPMHPLDAEPGDDPKAANPSLYFGSCGVLWALNYLRDRGATELDRDWSVDAAWLVQGTREWLKDDA